MHRQSADRLGVKGAVLFTYLINKARLQVLPPAPRACAARGVHVRVLIVHISIVRR